MVVLCGFPLRLCAFAGNIFLQMKIFTVQEANALLPEVRVIAGRIQRAHRQLSQYRDEAKKASEAAEQGGGGMAEGVAYAVILTQLTLQISELEALGVQLKDFERGLVDFPSLRDGRVVLLCWQLGEGDELEWWHDVDAGFAGRTPL
jgi:hypothetical protein